MKVEDSEQMERVLPRSTESENGLYVCVHVYICVYAVLKVGRYGTVCHTSTSSFCLKPYHHFLSEKYPTTMPDGNADNNACKCKDVA